MFFHSAASKRERAAKGGVLAVLFFAGAAYWVSFFHGGDLALTAYDWPKESAYLNTLRNAQVSGEIPWEWKEPYFKTKHFLGNPEIKLTPDIVFLRRLDNPTFALLHTLIFDFLGFWGSVLLARRVRASAAAFTIFWFFFNFNGYIAAHLAVGHLQWTGYFLFPFFFLFLLAFLEKSQDGGTPKDTTSVLGMGLVLATLLWNGSFHLVFFCLLFLSITFIFERSIWPSLLKVAGVTALLGMGRLLPALVSFWHENPSFISGYPGLSAFVDALTCLRSHTFGRLGGIGGDLGWWEYDIHIGFAGFALLAAIAWTTLRERNGFFPSVLLPAAFLMLLLSFGDIYAFLAKRISIPLADMERVSSRFVVLPFMVTLLAGIAGVDGFIRSHPRFGKPFLFSSLCLAVFEILQHASLWKISRVEASAEKGFHISPQLTFNSDSIYAASVWAGWFVSALSLLVALALFWQLRNSRSSREG